MIFLEKNMKNLNKKIHICVLGMGYVGLPLAVEFSKKYKVTGFDKNINRINNLKKGKDTNDDINFKLNKNITFTKNILDIIACNIYIVAVPTPINKKLKPNLTPLIEASKIIGKIIKKGDIVIYESTVYPGCTEGDCIPIIAKISGLKPMIDFQFAYSPERINPGDKKHTLTKIKKIVSASNSKTLNFLSKLYGSIIKAGIHKAKSIRIAEAAKVIENTQRDLNIAFMNELSRIFFTLDIKTKDVLEAANTKWNFLNFKPGLVGGHCIGVDPYYLTYISKKYGYMPNFLISGRSINNKVPNFIVNQIIKIVKKKNKNKKNFRAFIAGLTFKENVSDLRNSKVFDIITLLQKYKISITLTDPLLKKNDLPEKIRKIFKDKIDYKSIKTDIFILAVRHNELVKKINRDIKKIKFNNNNIIIVDLTSSLSIQADIEL